MLENNPVVMLAMVAVSRDVFPLSYLKAVLRLSISCIRRNMSS